MTAWCDVVADARHDQCLRLSRWGASSEVFNHGGNAGEVKIETDVLISRRKCSHLGRNIGEAKHWVLVFTQQVIAKTSNFSHGAVQQVSQVEAL